MPYSRNTNNTVNQLHIPIKIFKKGKAREKNQQHLETEDEERGKDAAASILKAVSLGLMVLPLTVRVNSGNVRIRARWKFSVT